MAQIAYFDCFSGCSGDMILGALLDAGLSLEALKTALSLLNLGGYQITCGKGQAFIHHRHQIQCDNG